MPFDLRRKTVTNTRSNPFDVMITSAVLDLDESNYDIETRSVFTVSEDLELSADFQIKAVHMCAVDPQEAYFIRAQLALKGVPANNEVAAYWVNAKIRSEAEAGTGGAHPYDLAPSLEYCQLAAGGQNGVKCPNNTITGAYLTGSGYEAMALGLSWCEKKKGYSTDYTWDGFEKGFNPTCTYHTNCPVYQAGATCHCFPDIRNITVVDTMTFSPTPSPTPNPDTYTEQFVSAKVYAERLVLEPVTWISGSCPWSGFHGGSKCEGYAAPPIGMGNFNDFKVLCDGAAGAGCGIHETETFNPFYWANNLDWATISGSFAGAGAYYGTTLEGEITEVSSATNSGQTWSPNLIASAMDSTDGYSRPYVRIFKMCASSLPSASWVGAIKLYITMFYTQDFSSMGFSEVYDVLKIGILEDPYTNHSVAGNDWVNFLSPKICVGTQCKVDLHNELCNGEYNLALNPSPEQDSNDDNRWQKVVSNWDGVNTDTPSDIVFVRDLEFSSYNTR